MNRKHIDVVLYGLFAFASILALVSSIVTLVGSDGDSLASQILLLIVFVVLTLATLGKLIKSILRLKAEVPGKTE